MPGALQDLQAGLERRLGVLMESVIRLAARFTSRLRWGRCRQGSVEGNRLLGDHQPIAARRGAVTRARGCRTCARGRRAGGDSAVQGLVVPWHACMPVPQWSHTWVPAAENTQHPRWLRVTNELQDSVVQQERRRASAALESDGRGRRESMPNPEISGQPQSASDCA